MTADELPHRLVLSQFSDVASWRQPRKRKLHTTHTNRTCELAELAQCIRRVTYTNRSDDFGAVCASLA